MVQVQSTWFPVIDRNPQRFVANIFEARDEDFQQAVHTVHHSSRHPSRVELTTLSE
jgi:predicted acyl esterase